MAKRKRIQRKQRDTTSVIPFHVVDEARGIDVHVDTIRYHREPVTTGRPVAKPRDNKRSLDYYVKSAEARDSKPRKQRVPRVLKQNPPQEVAASPEDYKQRVAKRFAERAAKSKWL